MADSGKLELGIVLTANGDAAVRGLKQYDDALKSAKKSTADLALGAQALQTVGRAIWGAGSGAMGGFFGLAKATGTFEQQVARVGLVSQASAADLASLRAAAMDMGMKGLAGPTDAAKALESLASQGLNAKESIGALRPTMDMMVGGSITAEAAASSLTSALKVFSLDADQAASVADRLLAISNATALAPKDLENALGTVGRGASLTKQSLNEMLPAMGLVRNTGVDASVAASSVSSALLHMADSSKKFKALGVNVTDASGEFRPFLDIVTETQKILEKKYPNAAERAAKANDLFSKFGLTAYSGITSQLTKGITDETGHLYQGAAAVEYLRQSMQNATGTAQKFSATMLEKDPFGRLAKTFEALKIEMGRGFLSIFGPAVSRIADGVAALTRWFGALPEPVRKAASAVMMGVAAFVGLTGAVVLTAAAFKLLAAGAGISMTGVMLAVLPVVAALGALAVLVGGGNLSGGLAGLASKVGLGIRGLGQAFGSGGELSGSVLTELNKLENVGVKRFVVNLYVWGARIKTFIDNAWLAFKDAMALARPTFEAVGNALGYLGRVLGIIDHQLPADASSRWDAWGSAGTKVGKAMGTLAEILGTALIPTLETLSGLVKGIKDNWKVFKSGIEDALAPLKELNAEIATLQKSLGIASENIDQHGTKWSWFGNVAQSVIFAMAHAWRTLVSLVTMGVNGIMVVVNPVVAVFETLQDTFMGLTTFLRGAFTLDWSMAWQGIARIVFSALAGPVRAILGMLEGLFGMIDAAGKVVGKDFGLKKTIQGVKFDTLDELATKLGLNEYGFGRNPGEQHRVPVAPETPEEARLRAEGRAYYGAAPTAGAPQSFDMEKLANRPMVLNANLTVDGRVLATIVRGFDRGDALSSFSPNVPTEEGAF